MYSYKKIEVTLGVKTRKLYLMQNSNFEDLKKDILLYFNEIKGNFLIFMTNRFNREIEVNESNFLEFKNNININNKLKIKEIPEYKELSKSSITNVQGDKDRIPFDELNIRKKVKLNKNINNNNGNEIC